jgi:hypothetical protein
MTPTDWIMLGELIAATITLGLIGLAIMAWKGKI